MASKGEVTHLVLQIIEADKFDVELDSIQVSMRFLWPTQEAGQKYETDSG